MTRDLLTFFHTGEAAGRDWTFSLKAGGDATTEFWVFDRGEADFFRFASADVTSEEEFKNLFNQLHATIQRRGGIYAYAWDHNGLVRIQLVQVEAPGYATPRRILRLSPAGEGKLDPITGSVDLAAGEHLVVPVSADAEDRLEAFCRQLKGFPADLETSILNIIRRPSLEWRIERIERTLSLPPASRAEQQRSRAQARESVREKLQRLFLRPVPLGPAILAALLLTAGSLGAYGALARNDAATDAVDHEADTAKPDLSKQHVSGASSQNREKRNDGENRLRTDFDQSLEALFAALKESKKPGLKGLYDSHFKDQAKDFSKATPIFWGLTKLQALQLGLITEGDSMLSDRNAQTSVKSVYGKPNSTATLKDNKEALDLLAWSCCQQPSQKPELPATQKDLNPLPLPYRDCKDLEPDDAVSGLNALTDWVKEQG